MQISRSFNLLAILAILLIAVSFVINSWEKAPNYEALASHFDSVVKEKEIALQSALYNVSDELNVDGRQGLYTPDQDIDILIYTRDTLTYWSDNSIPAHTLFTHSGLKAGLNHLKNGWYWVAQKSDGETQYLGLTLIKREYPFENRFLINGFQKDFALPTETRITNTVGNNSYPILQKLEGSSWYLDFEDRPGTVSELNSSNTMWSLTLFVIGTILLLWYLFVFFKDLGVRFGPWISVPALVITVLGLRYLSISFHAPSSLYGLALFSPSTYATSHAFGSLGDFLINSALAFFIALFVKHTTDLALKNESGNVQPSGYSVLNGSVRVFLALVSAYLFKELLSGLILNSSISFNVNNILELDYYSLVGFMSIGLFTIALFMIMEALFKPVFRKGIKSIFLSPVIGTLTFCAIWIVLGENDVWVLLSIITLAWAIGYGIWHQRTSVIAVGRLQYSFSDSILLIAVVSLFTTYIISVNADSKETAERNMLAQKLAAENDPIAEYMFEDLQKHLSNDTLIHKYLQEIPDTSQNISNHINRKYIKGFWAKYDVQVTVCNEIDSLLITDDNITRSCYAFFNGMVSDAGIPTVAPNFHFLENNNDRISYLAIINFSEATVFIEFDSKLIPEAMGFPELLLASEISEQIRAGLKTYSYAKYKDGLLTGQSGDFKYSTSEPVAPENSSDFIYVQFGGFHHLIYTPNVHNTILLSKPSTVFLDLTVRFSYLFAFFCTLTLLFVAANSFPEYLRRPQLNFRNRIQISMILILIVSLIPIGLGTKFYIEKQFHSRNSENIKEKIHSVLIEVEHKLADEDDLSPELTEYVSFILTKFSYVFFTDINLYDLKGELVASSRPEIFEAGLIGAFMNPEAYHQLKVNEQSEFIQSERIGELEFLSAYVPFRNKDHKLLAYLNLPYFAKEGALRNEISTFLVALINIYVVLIILSVIIAVLLSNRITKPLRIIQEKLANIKIGETNEPIRWDGKDEIGSLVTEYNRMLGEIEKSADLLARSEREGAWREMAKQVAHEIKNPLTPMKLSVQHLERAWLDKAPDWDQRLSQFAKTLVQQIDSLSIIASEFSDFAKMPVTKKEQFDLRSVISDTLDLFGNPENATIDFNPDDKEQMVYADREQILRALNNLTQNALQAIPEGRNGEIVIELSSDDSNYIVKVIDNGIGIDENEMEKIFAPSFTTKTSGMGLGLAIVKNIIENSDGKVWFESKLNVGSSFFFSLPKLKPSK